MSMDIKSPQHNISKQRPAVERKLDTIINWNLVQHTNVDPHKAPWKQNKRQSCPQTQHSAEPGSVSFMTAKQSPSAHVSIKVNCKKSEVLSKAKSRMHMSCLISVQSGCREDWKEEAKCCPFLQVMWPFRWTISRSLEVQELWQSWQSPIRQSQCSFHRVAVNTWSGGERSNSTGMPAIGRACG